MVGDNYELQGNVYHVEAQEEGTWWVIDAPGEPVYQFQIPQGCIMYYVEIGPRWLRLDVREGSMEFR